MKKFCLSLFMLACSSFVAQAIPANGQWKTHVQSDGSVIVLRLVGDEFCHYYEAEDGTILKQLANGDFVPSAEGFFTMEQRKAAAMQHRASVRKQPSASLKNSISNYTKRKGLVIIMEFPDQTMSQDNSWQQWNDILNKEGYNEYDAVGSVHDYFYDQSNGQFDISFDVFGPFMAQKGYSYYGTNGDSSDATDVKVCDLIEEACLAIRGQTDFSQYDWDNDGEVDQVVVLFAGIGENVTGTPSDHIWPHEYYLQYSDPKYYPNQGLLLDGIVINTYAVVSELNGPTILSGLGTFCHEFSHCLGLPDLYTYSGLDTNGGFDLMSSGSFNNASWTPSGYSAYEKMCCGWITPTPLTEPTTVTGLIPLADGGEAFIIRNESVEKDIDEYYLLENRQKTRWDQYIPSQGLIVTHVDYDPWAWSYNKVNDNASHPRVCIVPANNRWDERYAMGFAYPYRTLHSKNDSLTDNSKPAATLYHRPVGVTFATQYYLGKPITNITNSGGVVSFNLMGGNTSGIHDIAANGALSNWKALVGKPVKIYDLSGHLVYSTSSFISAESLPLSSGIYIVNGQQYQLK